VNRDQKIDQAVAKAMAKPPGTPIINDLFRDLAAIDGWDPADVEAMISEEAR
jgi:hypothetical protein